METIELDKLGYTQKHENFSNLKKEIDSTLFKAQNSGYIDAEIFEIKKLNDSVTEAILYLREKFNHIKLNYSLNEAERKQLKNLALTIEENYFIIPIYNIDKILNQLILYRTEKGEAFSSIKLINISKEKDELTAELDINVTKARTIDGIKINGYEKFPSAFLKHYLKIKKGQLYNSQKITSQSNKISNIAFASQIKPPEVLFTADSTVVHLYIKKENNNSFEGFLGFSNSEEKKLTFTGDLKLQLQNNLNYGEKLNIRYKSDGNDQINFNAQVDLPYILNFPIGVNLALDIFKQDSSYINIEQIFKIRYNISNSISSYLGYRSTTSTSLKEENMDFGNFEDFKSHFYSLGGTYQNLVTENRMVPIQTLISIDFATGKRNSGNNEIQQQKIEFQAAHNFYINEKNSVYIGNISSILFSEEYLENELFRFGGINSIRGFAENSLRANRFSALQTEYRYFLSPDLYINSIFDLAYFKSPSFNHNMNLYSFGIGFALSTKSGLLKANIANGRTEGESFQFSKSKIHLSLSVHF
ncbi:MAG TPA: POTRA domain-containing protein [Salinimicrobium sp.]|nr:POTRA domain-containing protein [Salinimicrobium sp.]